MVAYSQLVAGCHRMSGVTRRTPWRARAGDRGRNFPAMAAGKQQSGEKAID